jgi:hypothetical protein
MYKNNGDLTFADMSEAWGFKDDNFSNGAAYADLDNDGDLEIIINQQNASALIYRNHTRERNQDAHYLQLALSGKDKNTRAIGAKVRVYAGGNRQYVEHVSTRGFQSSVSDRMHIGLGTQSMVDSLVITWLSGENTVLTNVKADQLLKIAEDNTHLGNEMANSVATVFEKVQPIIEYAHIEQGFNDFKRQPLLMTMLTTCGPIMATGDVNNDGRVDAFVGGAQDNPGKIFIQNPNGQFTECPSDPINPACTDTDALFFDADGDGDQDLYIVSGGYNDYTEKDKALQDRLYINDGTGRYTLASSALPELLVSKSCVAASDFDHDGDLDLFVGGRVIPGQYPVTPESFLLQNNGGKFGVATAAIAPELQQIGMVTDSKWVDVNKDGWDDLVIIGEFMAVEIFINEGGKKLARATDTYFDQPLNGLWSRMAVHDFDHDGDDDIIVGNMGLNTQMRASPQEPISLVYKDFDNNGSIDPILTQYIKGKPYPFASRDELLDQIYSMRSKYTDYASYANVQLNDIFSANDLKESKKLTATTLETVYLENQGNKFVVHRLPAEAQFSPTYAIALVDFNEDGNMDFILGGNQSSIRIRVGVIDANFGQLFQSDGKGNFNHVSQRESGLTFTGDTKSLEVITIDGQRFMLVGVNNVGVETYKLK